jgi:hypothetical protein
MMKNAGLLLQPGIRSENRVYRPGDSQRWHSAEFLFNAKDVQQRPAEGLRVIALYFKCVKYTFRPR